MPIDKAAYSNLEQRFRDQVEKDKAYANKQGVKGGGVYLPFPEPENRVDYIFVGMEPSFGRWAKTPEEAEDKIEGGFRNGAPPRFTRCIKQFLCQRGETYHLTDMSKGAMLVKVAGRDRKGRWEEWYPLLLKEIEIVGKPGTPVIAIGREVENFLKQRDLKGRPFYAVPHYSYQNGRLFKREAEKDREGYEKFTKSEYGGNSPITKERMTFVYKKRFEAIRDCQRRAIA